MDSVQRWMSSPAIVAPETLTLPEARDLLRRKRIRHLPVVNADGRLVGIVTKGDIDRLSGTPHTDVQVYNLYYRLCDLPMGEIMSRPVVTVAPETSVCDAARLLWAHRISGMPVVQRDRVVGMITASDLFRLIVMWERADRLTAQVMSAG